MISFLWISFLPIKDLYTAKKMRLGYFSLSLSFLSLLVVVAATTPTFTWSVYGNMIPSSQPPSTCPPGSQYWYCTGCSPLTYVNALYYWTVEIGRCTCWCGTYHETTYLIQGPQDLDTYGAFDGVFSYNPPVECDIGTDMTIMCKQTGDNTYLYMDPPLNDPQGFGLMGQINGPSIVRVSVGNNKWIVGILSGGGSMVYTGSNTWNFITSTVPHLVEISIGNDGVFAYIPLGGTAPYGCQLNGDMSGSVSNCKQLGGTGSYCRGLHVVNANNIVCWSEYGFYWLNGSGGWVSVSLPVAMDQTCFTPLTGNPFSCLTRPSLGGPNASGTGIFSYLGTDGQWHAGTFPFQ